MESRLLVQHIVYHASRSSRSSRDGAFGSNSPDLLHPYRMSMGRRVSRYGVRMT